MSAGNTKNGFKKVGAVKITISMPPQIHADAITLASLDGFPTFSNYVQNLIRADKARRQRLPLAA